jgi:predicted component of type VI protein secretion system
LGNTAQLKLRFLARAPVALPQRFAQIALVQLCGIALVFLSQFCYNANSRAKEITA